MIYKAGQIMLNVNNQDEAVNFWIEKVGFKVISDNDNGQVRECDGLESRQQQRLKLDFSFP